MLNLFLYTELNINSFSLNAFYILDKIKFLKLQQTLMNNIQKLVLPLCLHLHKNVNLLGKNSLRNKSS